MKSLMTLAIALSLAPAAFARTPVSRAPAYKVEVGVDSGLTGESRLSINYETVQIYSSMCGRKTSALELRVPQQRTQIGIPTPAIGVISFETKLTANTLCLQAFGPHRGGVTLELGDAIPAIGNGYYALKIDGISYGYVVVADGEASLIGKNELPQ